MALHEALAEIFRTFKLGGCLAWTDNLYRTAFEVVIDTIDQWILWTDDDHLNLLLVGKLGNLLELVDLDGYVLSVGGSACVAWGDKEFVTLGALCQLPCDGAFTAATAEE